jgi:hypothetical protein
MNAITQTNAPNGAAMFTVLKPKGKRASAEEVTAQLRKALGGITGANILIISPRRCAALAMRAGSR